MRATVAALLIFAALPALARWQACPSTCSPPTEIVSGLSYLPLYSGRVKFLREEKSGGGFFWLWVRVDAPPKCTAAQLVNQQDRDFGCGAKVGEVLLRTGRIRQVP